MSTTSRGPGLPGITRDGGERAITGVHRQAGTGRAPGSALIALAAWLLALTGGGALFVSFSAQYAYIFRVRRQDAASVIEASAVISSSTRTVPAPSATSAITFTRSTA